MPDPALRDALHTVCERVAAAGGRALAVGGCVRDSALGRTARDVDVEVFGLAPERLGEVLGAAVPVLRVGQAFPIFRLGRLPLDVAVPRRIGEREAWDPDATPETAALRRDFTLNAIALDPLTGEVIDPLGGLGDLRARRLRHGSPRFDEDPLRVLRAMQLSARFRLDVAPETVLRCRRLDADGLARERVFGEWRRLLLEGEEISRGLRFLRACGWTRTVPELEALIDVPQDPTWHPEGCVWTHTLHCMDVFAAERTGEERDDLVVGLAVLCHDLGKPVTTRVDEDGRVRCLGHERAGEAPTRRLLARWTDESALAGEVVPLVLDHLAPVQLHAAGAGPAAVRRLARRAGRIDRLVRVASADQQGRPPRVMGAFEAGDWLLARAAELGVLHAPPEPLVQGRHLIALGLEPGPPFGPILEACYAAQLDGRIRDEAEGIAFAEARIRES